MEQVKNVDRGTWCERRRTACCEDATGGHHLEIVPPYGYGSNLNVRLRSHDLEMMATRVTSSCSVLRDRSSCVTSNLSGRICQ
jgi:hypothetical protein